MHTAVKTARGSVSKGGGERDVIRGVAQYPAREYLPRRGRSPAAVGLPGGRGRLGRVLARDGVSQGGGGHRGTEYGRLRPDKDGLGRHVRDRGVPGCDGRAGAGGGQAGDVGPGPRRTASFGLGSYGVLALYPAFFTEACGRYVLGD